MFVVGGLECLICLYTMSIYLEKDYVLNKFSICYFVVYRATVTDILLVIIQLS